MLQKEVMAQIIAFAGSNSSTSINFKLVKYIASLCTSSHQLQLLNMVHYPFPLYSEDLENTQGFSNSLLELSEDIRRSDGLIVGVNEHNGNLSAYSKNLIDWLSRVNRNFLAQKPILLTATSRGKRGAISALEIMEKTLPRFGAEVKATFSLPSFDENFKEHEGILNSALKTELTQAIAIFNKALG